MWKWLFIGGTVLLLYISYASGITQRGIPFEFFGGLIVGYCVHYLFGKYRQEAINNTNTNNQTVNVNLTQNRIKAVGEMSGVELVQLIDSVLEKKLVEADAQRYLNGNVQSEQRRIEEHYESTEPQSRREDLIARTLRGLRG